jgi:SAM-dependent methyltransferase
MHRNSPDAPAAAGYVTDVAYPETFFRELSPVWLNYVAALGQVPARDLRQPFMYLELGCGCGGSVITHAAAFPQARFHACDFNRTHIESARERTAVLGIDNVELTHCTFAQLLDKPLPAFDFIVAHGVYSWVGAAERRAIRELVRQYLQPGGLVYLSYNSLPGWAAEMPLRKLLIELAAGAGAEGSLGRAGRAVRSLQTLSRTGGLKFAAASPACSAALAACLRAPLPYIAHEFLNETWEPFYGVDVADQMQQAGVAYVGSATLADNHPLLLVDETTLQGIGQLPTERQRRIALDFATQQHFRRDVFWRPVPGAGSRALESLLIGCVDDPRRLRPPIRVPRGLVHFQEDFLYRLRGLLQRGPQTLGAAVADLAGGAHGGGAEIGRNLLYLVAAGALAPFARASAPVAWEGVRQPLPQDAPGRKRDLQPASPIIERALRYSLERETHCVLPSELLGNGVRLELAEAAALLRCLAGERATPSCTELVRKLLRLGILREG